MEAMAQFMLVSPIGGTDPLHLPVADVHRAVAYYQDRLASGWKRGSRGRDADTGRRDPAAGAERRATRNRRAATSASATWTPCIEGFWAEARACPSGRGTWSMTGRRTG